MRHISIKWRLTIWFTVVMVVITALMQVFVMLMNRNAVTRPPQAEVVRMVERNADDIEFDHGRWDLSDVEFFAHGVYTEIFDESGARLAGSPPVGADIPLPTAMATTGGVQVVDSGGGSYYVYDKPLDTGISTLWVRGTIPTDAQGSVMEVIVPLTWALLPALVVVSAVGGWLISTLSFRPMEKVIAAAESISGGEDLTRRIGLPRGRSEIHRLAAAYDDMFDRLERSFEAEAQFTSDAGHELRTPVTVILAQCETLERGEPTVEEYENGVSVIHGQAEQMSRLIAQLLHITRLEQGTQKANFEPTDLGELAEIICEQQRMTAPEGTTLTCRAQPVTVPLDVTLMTRLMNNLLSNAFRYGKPNGHVTVTVRQDGSEAVLAVSDDGIGITPEQLPKIWQRFYQADPSRSGSEGTGLGLYMVRQIAQLHGGTAAVDSVAGQGSTFTIRLPLQGNM